MHFEISLPFCVAESFGPPQNFFAHTHKKVLCCITCKFQKMTSENLKVDMHPVVVDKCY